jgi:hypothetical protein
MSPHQVPRRASLKRNVGSVGKKKRNKSTELGDISNLKFCQRKPGYIKYTIKILGKIISE